MGSTPRTDVADFLAAPGRQARVVNERAHRPWPLPERSWLMGQTWDDLLFAHWALPPAELAGHVPPELPLDTFDGRAWLGITPFVLRGLRAIATPPLPALSQFPELNVRTYVTLEGKPGIYFFSLDAASALAVAGARRFYRLPYFLARMSAVPADGRVRYASRRADTLGHPAQFRADYGPTGEPEQPTPGTLEYFLTERYCLYTVEGGRVFRGEIHHPPWPLRPAEAEIELNTMPPPALRLPPGPPLLHFADRQDVVIWSLEPVAV
jgi:uncharacterized protein YqjF (DUF2071 family)